MGRSLGIRVYSFKSAVGAVCCASPCPAVEGDRAREKLKLNQIMRTLLLGGGASKGNTTLGGGCLDPQQFMHILWGGSTDPQLFEMYTSLSFDLHGFSPYEL